MELLRKLTTIPAPSGHEDLMRDFLMSWFEENKNRFRARPVIHAGDDMQSCLAVSFGKPRTAVFAHMDTVAFMVKYGSELIEIGNPEPTSGDVLVGEDDE